ncbi:serine/threonine-protein kinase [Frankia sp. EAN1pec]|uniref:protein kinase domain-containing protein n=1 Tax=Parafrankia sp. (strain EAN1pec) TaxID=298653 RepID=UPI0018DB69A8
MARTLGGRFVLEEPRIGHGGFGDVYRAMDRKQPGRNAAPVAVKLMRDASMVDPEAVRRFERELRLLEPIRHPNIVPILGHGKTPAGAIWYAMPLAQGSLVDFAEELHGRNALILDLMRQVGAGLTHIHDRKIYHRDLKPGNILRLADGVWAIADFGLAVDAERATTALTSTLRGIGTAWYTAPEQWRDARNVNHLADVFGLGKVLQELVIGDAPVTNEVPPGPLRPIVQRAIAERPEHRYASVRDFLAALATAIETPRDGWESAEGTAERLLERVRLPKAAEVDLDELATWALALDESDTDDMTALARVLPWISTRSIHYLWAADPAGFQRIFRHYSKHVETTGFGFEYCDVLADFSRRAVKETDDSDVLREAIRSLVELGHRHSRWRVRGVVTTILQGIRKPEPALAAVEALRAADVEAVEWTLSEFSIRSLPPILRNEINMLLSAASR